MANKRVTEKRPGSYIPENSLRQFSREPRTCQSKIFIKTYGWPYIPVRRDDFGAVEEDKWFGVKELGKI